MNSFNIKVITVAISLAFSAGAIAASMTKDEYKAGQENVAVDYKKEKAACDSLSANAKDVCVAEAKGQEKVATAQLESAYKPSRKATYEVQVAKAEATKTPAQKHKIVVVNDNPYSLILNEHPMSIMQVPGAKDCCIEFNSLSKSHNMPGWRVAMISSNKTFISWILKVKSNIDNGSFRGIQLAAAEAMLNNTDEWHRENNIQNYRRRRDIAEEIMKVLDCQFDPNQVGMFLWGKIPEKYADVEDLTEKILHEARVFITPGFIFGTNGKRYIRISLCAKDEKMKEALERIKKVFEK